MIKSLTLRQSWLLPATLFIVAGLPAKTLILPVEAIVDSGQLSAEDFKKKYPGIDITGSVPDEEGWYVRYTHENLCYYFGPLENYNDALQKKLEMDEIRDAVLYEAPELSDSTIEVFQFSYEMFSEANAPGSAGAEGEMPGQLTVAGASDANTPEGADAGEQQGQSDQMLGQMGQQEQAGDRQQPGFPQFPIGQNQQSSQRSGSPSIQQGQQSSRSLPFPSQSSGGRGPPIPSQGGSGGPPIPGGSGEQGPPSPSQGGGIPIWQIIRKIFWGR